MDWKDFFKLRVYKHTPNGTQLYFDSQLKVPEQFAMQELMMNQFAHWNISESEKRVLSLNLRKVLLRHSEFLTPTFQKICHVFQAKVSKEISNHLEFTTSGGGIYLFLALQGKDIVKKQIICHTSELPIPICKLGHETAKIQFIYRPQAASYLANFPSLWQESELLSLFELTEYKSKVA